MFSTGLKINKTQLQQWYQLLSLRPDAFAMIFTEEHLLLNTVVPLFLTGNVHMHGNPVLSYNVSYGWYSSVY